MGVMELSSEHLHKPSVVGVIPSFFAQSMLYDWHETSQIVVFDFFYGRLHSCDTLLHVLQDVDHHKT
jgi:hypothetical protein